MSDMNTNKNENNNVAINDVNAEDALYIFDEDKTNNINNNTDNNLNDAPNTYVEAALEQMNNQPVDMPTNTTIESRNNTENIEQEENKKEKKNNSVRNFLLALLLLLFLGVATLPFSYPVLRDTLPEGTLPETIPLEVLIGNLYGIDWKSNENENLETNNETENTEVTNNKIEDAFMSEIRRIIKDLFNNDKKDKIRKILKDIGYTDAEIDKVIDNYDDIIEKIEDKIDSGEYTGNQIIDIIESELDPGELIDDSGDEIENSDTTTNNNDTTNNNQTTNNNNNNENTITNNDSQSNDNSGSTNSSTTIVENKNLIVEFSNVKMLEGSNSTIAPTIVDNKQLNFNTVLDNQGDYYAFTVDITNKSTMDAQIDNITSSVLTAEQNKYLAFSLTYANGTAIKKGDTLNAGETKTLKFVALSRIGNIQKEVTATYNGEITFVQSE